jgi:tetratricopeptide (TPR) repeat protein
MKRLIILLLLLPVFGVFGQTADDYFKKSSAEKEKESYKAALKSIDKAIELDDQNPEYQLYRSGILVELKQYQEAVDACSQAIKLKKSYAEAYNSRAILHEAFGQIELAFRDFDYAIKYAEDDKRRYSYTVNRAILYINTRDYKKAYSELISAYNFDSTDVVMLNNLAIVCDELDKKEQALQYLFRVVELDSTLYAANTNIGFIYQKMGRHEDAIVYFDKHNALDPNDAYVYNNRAYSKLQLNDIKGAMADVEKSIRLFPGNAYAYRNRALIYLAQGKSKQACEDLRMAIKLGFTEQYGPEVEELLKKHCL